MRAAVINIGCRLNQSEGDCLRHYLRNQGCELDDSRPSGDALRRRHSVPGKRVDLVIVNTCTVTREAERSSLNRIRRIAALEPKPHLIVTGCMAERVPDRLRAIAGVDEVLGIWEKERLIAGLAPLPNRSRAFLKVQDGCANHCSFCVVSTLRGDPISKPLGQVRQEAEHLLEQGFQEIVLTGLNLGTYGADSGSSLVALLEELARLPGSWRLRLGSLEPDTITDDLIRQFAHSMRNDESEMRDSPFVCPHVHIPLQSGDDRLLRAMNRRYTAVQYQCRIEELARRIPDITIGTDIVVGFPGEDETAFAATRRMVEGLPFGYLHVFSYLSRPGTTAFALADSVPRSVNRLRVTALRALGAQKSLSHRSRFVGQQRSAIFLDTVGDPAEETTQSRSPTNHSCSPGSVLTDNYIRVLLEESDPRCAPTRGAQPCWHCFASAPGGKSSGLVRVQIGRVEKDHTFGSVTENNGAADAY